jgi:DNA repair protein RecN (Recombination protein N)
MLKQINLKNFVIIDELELELQPNMTVITGETGAGKSIIIDALELLLGNRLENQVIRENTDRCEISAVFIINQHQPAKEWLIEHELDHGEECILRRVISQDGRSKNYINGQPCTLQLLASLGELLVNIHGQHAHQNLLKRDYQRIVLDTYADHQSHLTILADLHLQWKTLQNKLSTLKNSMDDHYQKQDYLNFQIYELEQLALCENEITNLEQEHKKLTNADQLISHCNLAITLLSDNENNVKQQLQQVLTSLLTIKEHHHGLKNSYELLQNALIQIDEATSEIHYFQDHFNLDPERLHFIEQRLSTVYDIARKHRINPHDLPTFHQELIEKLNEFKHAHEYADQLEIEIKQIEEEYYAHAEKLSASRKKTSHQLEKLITEKMQELGMTGGRFAILLNKNSDKKITPHGLEQIEFQVSANPGMALQSLNKIASGGEISRISLAIQVITALKITTPTLIFDEVDTGIGGAVAAIVGKLLRQLSQSAQVLCITHIPQVATYGHQHLHVEKHVKNNLTTTTIKPLSVAEKTREIARMLGGIHITEQTIAHAKEMLDTVT